MGNVLRGLCLSSVGNGSTGPLERLTDAAGLLLRDSVANGKKLPLLRESAGNGRLSVLRHPRPARVPPLEIGEMFQNDEKGAGLRDSTGRLNSDEKGAGPIVAPL